MQKWFDEEAGPVSVSAGRTLPDMIMICIYSCGDCLFSPKDGKLNAMEFMKLVSTGKRSVTPV